MSLDCDWGNQGNIPCKILFFVFFFLFVAVTCLWTVIGVIKGIFVVRYFCFVLFCLWLSHVFGL